MDGMDKTTHSIEQNSDLAGAAKCGDTHVLRSLICQGAKVSGRDRDGMTPLHVAVLSKQKAAAKVLIAAGADVNAIDAQCRTPLYIAAEIGDQDTALVLIAAGANLDVPNQWGRTPMYAARLRNRLTVTKVLDSALHEGKGCKSLASQMRAKPDSSEPHLKPTPSR